AGLLQAKKANAQKSRSGVFIGLNDALFFHQEGSAFVFTYS
ncbi:MAG: hypothetical protein RLZZ77_1845, partial [Bacteroidota bacterium]